MWYRLVAEAQFLLDVVSVGVVDQEQTIQLGFLCRQLVEKLAVFLRLVHDRVGQLTRPDVVGSKLGDARRVALGRVRELVKPCQILVLIIQRAETVRQLFGECPHRFGFIAVFDKVGQQLGNLTLVRLLVGVERELLYNLALPYQLRQKPVGGRAVSVVV